MVPNHNLSNHNSNHNDDHKLGHTSASDFKLIVGYAGWGIHQLQGECDMHSWFLSEGWIDDANFDPTLTSPTPTTLRQTLINSNLALPYSI